MAGLLVTAFLPDEWSELRSLLEILVPDGTGLYRWDEHRFEDGTWLRSASIARNEGGPPIDEIVAYALESAELHGFRPYAYDESFKRTSLQLPAGGRRLRVWQEPLPPRAIIDLADPHSPLELASYPVVQSMLRLTAASGAGQLRALHRFAELDLEAHDRFFPPTTSMTVRGPYDGERMCVSLAAAGFSEEGDAWIREEGLLHAEVRLRDDIAILMVPALLRTMT